MPRTETVFACVACQFRTPKWLGRCPECGEWGTIGEAESEAPAGRDDRKRGASDGATARKLTEIDAAESPRLLSGLADFDRVLGGGIVAGGAVLLGGEPGIGKSTLLLQVANALAEREGRPVLYVSGEESAQQVRLRAERLGKPSENLYLLVETSIERILSEGEKLRPAAVIVDSIQTTATDAAPSGPGSLSQVRESAARLTGWAKRSGTPLFLIGHVTKDGSIAGPKTLEHVVDTVLYFEGERFHRHRIVRAHKNRFGPVHEVGIFEMRDVGLVEVQNPSALLLSQRSAGAAGSAVLAALEGTRPLLVEVQALVTATHPGAARRVGIGVDPQRLSLLLAVLERRAGLPTAASDVYASVAGGLSIEEPAADLAIAAAILSSHRNVAIPEGTVVFGEVGLLGEIRAVGGAEERVREGISLGFARVIVPAANVPELARLDTAVIEPVSRLEELAERLSPASERPAAGGSRSR